MSATIASEDCSMRDIAPLAMNHSQQIHEKAYDRKRAQEKVQFATQVQSQVNESQGSDNLPGDRELFKADKRGCEVLL